MSQEVAKTRACDGRWNVACCVVPVPVRMLLAILNEAWSRGDVSEKAEDSRSTLGGNSHCCREVRKVSRYLHRGERRAHEGNRRKPQVIKRNGKEKVNCK